MSFVSVKHDAVPGRLRVEVASLRGQPARCSRLQDILGATGVFSRVRARPASGSLIVDFARDECLEAVLTHIETAVSGSFFSPDTTACASRPTSHEIIRSVVGGKSPPAPDRTAHSAPLAEIVQRHESDADRGLSEAEVHARLRRFGPNALPEGHVASPLELFVKQFDSLPVALLAGSAVISVATGGIADAIATLGVVAINGVLGYVTEGQAEKTIQRLIDTSEQKCVVLRDGEEQVISARFIVPGDVMLLRPGHHIAADARIIDTRGLLVDESALTGESISVIKRPEESLHEAAAVSAMSNMVFAGTLVTGGKGKAIVVGTGATTQIAGIQSLTDTAERPKAPVEKDLDDIGARLVGLSLAACGVFFALGYLRGYQWQVMLRDALALAVAAVPEGLPTVATTTMARGIKKMEKNGILIRQLDVVESLGALQTLCLDKTGTLTANTMEVAAIDAGGRRYDVHDDTILPIDDDTAANAALNALMDVIVLNSEAVFDVDNGGVDPQSSSPTERALLQLAHVAGHDIAGLRGTRPTIRYLDREDGRRYTTSIHDGEEGRLVTIKGSPAEILARCDRHRRDGLLCAMTSADRNRILARNDALAAMPARVLGFASSHATMEAANPDDTFVWHGLVAMIDPLRPGAANFIAALHRAGIATTMITGDQTATAQAIAEQLDLGHGEPIRVIDAGDLSSLDPSLLSKLATQAHAFARVSPQQKLTIVRALQDSGRVVGMTGDGINDGPALKAADVGIAMGKSGSNLARDVANVVIADDQLPTLVMAIAQGRTVFRNIRRSLEYLVTTNLSEIMVGMVEAVHGPGELETPMELLWVNLVTDIFPGLGLAMARPDEDIMDVAPRDGANHIIPSSDAKRMGLDGAIIAASALAAHFHGLARYGPGPETRGITFNTLVMGQLLYTFGAQRFEKGGIGLDRVFQNKTLDAAMLGSFGLQVLPFTVPPLRRLLGIAPLRAGDLGFSLAAATVPVGVALTRHAIKTATVRAGKDG